jgi:PAS domain S-box-containing protein
MRKDQQQPSQFRALIRELPAPHAGARLPVFPERFARLLSGLEVLGIWICEFDQEGRLVYTSPNVSEIIGFTPEECLARDVLEFHPDDLAGIVENGKKIRSTGLPVRSLGRVRHRDGHWVWTDTSILGWYATEGGEFHTITIAQNITDLKNAEAAREESETRLLAISQMSWDLISEIDPEGRTTYISPGCEEVLGYTAEEVTEVPPWSLLHPEDADRIRAHIEQEFRAGVAAALQTLRKLDPIEYRICHRDGHWLRL